MWHQMVVITVNCLHYANSICLYYFQRRIKVSLLDPRIFDVLTFIIEIYK